MWTSPELLSHFQLEPSITLASWELEEANPINWTHQKLLKLKTRYPLARWVFWLLKIKCRHRSPEINHVLIIHLCCLSLENFKIEISGKFKVQTRAIKIHVCLWSIILLLCISEIVRKFATSFLFTFFIFVENWIRYRGSGWATMEVCDAVLSSWGF